MHYVVLGTAGHIDHGKSRLVKALTGIDPDRLKEEKERGITIDLGFADLRYPDGLAIGIVDVPGHERLVRNMLAGAGGIDIVLLVIAADEGVMPQSREHLHICNLLKIQSGLIVLTKTDLVEPDWVQLVAEEARDFVKGTFLEGAEIVPVSSKTGHNIELLKEKIREVALRSRPKPSKGLFRLPIDRVFTLKGFGTVVTGTAVSGSAALDETVEILPKGMTTRIRGLQSHGQAAKRVYAGQRVALNLQGVEKDELRRGDTLVSAGRLSPTGTLDAKVQMLSEIKNRELVHFHLGTSETVARIVLYGREKLPAGESSYCQLRLQERVVSQAGDRFIIRRFSPLETIGGGEVLDPSARRRKKKEGVEDLKVLDEGSLSEKIAMKVGKSSLKGMSRAEVEGWIRAETPEIESAVSALLKNGIVMELEGLLFHSGAFGQLKASVVKALEDFHRENPLRHGMPKEELRAQFGIQPRTFGALIGAIEEVAPEKDLLRLKGFRASLSGDEKARLLELLERKGFHPPTKAELAPELSMSEKELGDVLALMQREGSVVRISDQICLSASTYGQMMELIKGFFSKRPEMSVSDFRDLLGTSRKYAVPFLEHLDSSKITLRVGDIRKFLRRAT